MATKSILMVCMGNICRSPMAEGILREMARKHKLDVRTDSAGTIRNHVGEAPDPRALACMRKYGIDISDLRARQVTAADFERFDLLLAMDEDNLRELRRLARDPALARKAQLMMDHAPDHALREVPDPWYGEAQGFDEVYEMLTIACGNLVKSLRNG